jgi:hypothetical protein
MVLGRVRVPVVLSARGARCLQLPVVLPLVGVQSRCVLRVVRAALACAGSCLVLGLVWAALVVRGVRWATLVGSVRPGTEAATVHQTRRLTMRAADRPVWAIFHAGISKTTFPVHTVALGRSAADAGR